MELEVNKFYFPKPFLKNATYLQMLIATRNKKKMLKLILLKFFDVQLNNCKYVPTIVEIEDYCENPHLFFRSLKKPVQCDHPIKSLSLSINQGFK